MNFLRAPAWQLAFASAAFAAAATAQPDKAWATPAYHSVFEGYKRHSDEPVLSWRQANDTVRQIGGWRAYAREAQAAAAAEGAASSPSPPAGARHHRHQESR